MEVPSVPFKILALAPFGTQDDVWPHEPVSVDPSNVDQVMENLGLSVDIPIPRHLCPSGTMNIRIRRMKDFHPDGMVEGNRFLKNLLAARKFASESVETGLSEEEVLSRLKGWPDLPIEMRFEPRQPQTGHRSPVDDILRMVAVPGETSPTGAEPSSPEEKIDALLRQVLRHLYACPKLRELESAWEGLRCLLRHEGGTGDVVLEIVPVSPENIEETLSRLLPGLIEDLPSLILLDLPFDSSTRSLDLLQRMAGLAEALMAPALYWIVPGFFHLDQWKDLTRVPFLPHYLEEPAFAKWRKFRKTPPARWVAATCNRFLVRFPYGPDNRPRHARFEELENLWISPVWAAGSLVARSLGKTGWPTRFTEWREIRLEDLALTGIEANKTLPTEAHFTEERIDQFLRAGIIPIVSTPSRDVAFLPGETTVAGGSLCYQLFLSRIIQVLLKCKDTLEDDLEPAEVEKRIEQAFSVFFERNRSSAPRDFRVAVNRPAPDKPMTVSLRVEPSRQMLPSGEKVELELNW